MILSPDQENALNKVELFLNNKDRIFILKGGAGTGKTTLIKEIINTIKSINLINDLQIYWQEIQNKNRLIDEGIINRFIPSGKAGFIRSNNNGDIYFNKRAFTNNDQMKLSKGSKVSFVIEDSWDKKQKRLSKTAVNCSIINN